FRRFRPLRRFRSHLWRGEIKLENYGFTDSLSRAHLRQHKHSTLEARLAAPKNGSICCQADQICIGRLMLTTWLAHPLTKGLDIDQPTSTHYGCRLFNKRASCGGFMKNGIAQLSRRYRMAKGP